MDDLYTITPQQAAARTGFSANTIKKWCRAEMLPCLVSPSGHFRIRPDDLASFIKSMYREKSGVKSVKSVNAENSP